MAVNVGYPDRWDTYLDNAPILSAAQGGSYLSNILDISRAARQEASESFLQPADKTEWMMSTYTVNAYYSFAANSINFPAGILQAPLYDLEASSAENLGGIGYIIAHETTHAFDNNGARYDSQGNAANWWTEEDYAAFEALCGKVEAFYDGLEEIPGVPCNGRLTLSENIADLGAAACITQAEGMREEPDYAALSRSAARSWTFPAGPCLYGADRRTRPRQAPGQPRPPELRPLLLRLRHPARGRYVAGPRGPGAHLVSPSRSGERRVPIVPRPLRPSGWEGRLYNSGGNRYGSFIRAGAQGGIFLL